MLLPDGFIGIPRNESDLDFLDVPQNVSNLTVLRGWLWLYYWPDENTFRFVVNEIVWSSRVLNPVVNISSFQLLCGFTDLNYYHHHFNMLFSVCLFENGDVVLLVSRAAYPDIMHNRRDGVSHIRLLNNQIWYAHEHMQSLILPLPSPGMFVFHISTSYYNVYGPNLYTL